MLVLFAPQAVSAASQLPVLVVTLLSRQPRLRNAAARTLRHLAERDAHAVLAAEDSAAAKEGGVGSGAGAGTAAGGIVRPLFIALDSETDPGIAAQLSAALRTLLVAGAPAHPSRWLALCSEVALAAAPGGSAELGARADGGSVAERGAEHGEDEDEDVMDEESTAHASGPAARPGSGSGSAAAPGAAASTAVAGFSPRLRTRLFAAGLLLQLPGVVCEADPRHADPASLGGGGGSAAGVSGDWLIRRLQQLVEAGFRMASGQLEALRPAGLRLLAEVVRRFGDAADPLLEGHCLLEQYQAQVVSALR